MFIQTEATPNPSTLKFIPGREVLASGTADFRDSGEAGSSPLARRLFAIDGVNGVFLGSDFISVTKGTAEWQHLKPMILGAIMEHYQSGEATGQKADAETEGSFDPQDADTVRTIKELLETRVRPAVAQDGGDILFARFEPDTGVVWLHMRGACAGCPSSAATLKAGVENMLRHYVPEVTRVEQAL